MNKAQLVPEWFALLRLALYIWTSVVIPLLFANVLREKSKRNTLSRRVIAVYRAMLDSRQKRARFLRMLAASVDGCFQVLYGKTVGRNLLTSLAFAATFAGLAVVFTAPTMLNHREEILAARDSAAEAVDFVLARTPPWQVARSLERTSCVSAWGCPYKYADDDAVTIRARHGRFDPELREYLQTDPEREAVVLAVAIWGTSFEPGARWSQLLLAFGLNVAADFLGLMAVVALIRQLRLRATIGRFATCAAAALAIGVVAFMSVLAMQEHFWRGDVQAFTLFLVELPVALYVSAMALADLVNVVGVKPMWQRDVGSDSRFWRTFRAIGLLGTAWVFWNDLSSRVHVPSFPSISAELLGENRVPYVFAFGVTLPVAIFLFTILVAIVARYAPRPFAAVTVWYLRLFVRGGAGITVASGAVLAIVESIYRGLEYWATYQMGR